ncbi:E3 ubiquitin-protein ligase [Wolffia australiana]
MASSSSSSSSPSSSERELQELLDAARPFLRGELEKIDPELPQLAAVLRSVGAGECWHKHGSFLDHLLEVYRILKLWSAPDMVARCGLFHSAYSNSYVNLAIFDPSISRDHVKSLIGAQAERLVHLFCIVPRHSLIHDDLLSQYSDSELDLHLRSAESGENAAWRRKIRSVLPAEGIKVRHIRTGEEVGLSRRAVAVFLLMTMADFSDQLFAFQDELFENGNGRLEFSGDNYRAIWPGSGRPGRWMSSISRMAALYAIIAREEELYVGERKGEGEEGRDEEMELAIPPVFEGCRRVVKPEEEGAAVELYWAAVSGGEAAEERLRECVEKNPFVGEPRLVLAQVYLGDERFEEAAAAAAEGLRLLLGWGSAWDKRMSWEGWVAWGRVLLMSARDRSWPRSSWGVVNLGLVR